MANKIKASDHESYGVISLMSFFIPIVGFIVGAIYLTKDEKVDKKLGEHAIVLAIFGIIVAAILWFVWINSMAVKTEYVPLY